MNSNDNILTTILGDDFYESSLKWFAWLGAGIGLLLGAPFILRQSAAIVRAIKDLMRAIRE